MVEFAFKSLCGTCHQKTKLEDGGDLKWTVEPVGRNERWFPKAKFDHGSHRIVDCSDCHNAKEFDEIVRHSDTGNGGLF